MSVVKMRSKSIAWLKENLFNSWKNTILTCLSASILFFITKGILIWVAYSAEWEVIYANIRLLMVGQYPVEEVWRIWTILCLAMFLLGISWGVHKGIFTQISIPIIVIYTVIAFMPLLSFATRIWLLLGIVSIGAGFWIGRTFGHVKRLNLVCWVVCFPLIILLINGFGVFKQINSNLWGGFYLTILIAVVTIVFSFPLGILLSLGRRSKLPVVKWFCIFYIEIIRGVPLITVLFMSQLLLPLFIGNAVELSNVLRVMIGFTLFNAAYVAETVRGGMQAIPRGQYEAAEALGLNYVQRITFIIMPQALRNVIPALVGTIIEVFKDTSLVAIVSLMDLMGIAKRIIANPRFLGRQMEVFIFVAAIFLVFCLILSKVSKSLEVSLNRGKS